MHIITWARGMAGFSEFDVRRSLLLVAHLVSQDWFPNRTAVCESIVLWERVFIFLIIIIIIIKARLCWLHNAVRNCHPAGKFFFLTQLIYGCHVKKMLFLRSAPSSIFSCGFCQKLSEKIHAETAPETSEKQEKLKIQQVSTTVSL